MSIKAKQVAGVTTLVVLIVAMLSAYHLATLARLSLSETASRGQMIARAIYQRAREVVPQGGADPYATLRNDESIRSMLDSSAAYSLNVIDVAIVDTHGVAVAHNVAKLEGTAMPDREELATLLDSNPLRLLWVVYYSYRNFEVRVPMLAGDTPFGAIRIGVSLLLVRETLNPAIRTAVGLMLVALLSSSLLAVVMAGWMLRPIHVIQSGLSRLGRGELDVRLDLPGQEFRDLGTSFEAVSAQLAAVGRSAAGAPMAPGSAATDLESVMDNLEDAVALFSPRGELIFSNSAMDALLGEIERPSANPDGPLSSLPNGHPLRQMIERTLADRKPQGPISIAVRATPAAPETDERERLVMSHAVEDSAGRLLGAMLVARNLGYLSHIQTTLQYSRKLAALGRLMAGVAHEVKNPLNAMTIHLELLKQKLARQAMTAAAPADRVDGAPDVTKHVAVIANEIKRLDEVLNSFLKFARPDELKLQPVTLASLIGDVATAAAPEASTRGVALTTECPDSLRINGDPGMLRQALLNLALNACQAMPTGGTLRLLGRAAGRRVHVDVEDSGVGIAPEHLGRIFDLYFTTKEKGSGIGLSMVYRTVQLHDGDIEVQSTPGHGTRFRLIFPQA